MEDKHELVKSKEIVLSEKTLQLIQELSKYGKVIGQLVIGQLILMLAITIGYVLFVDKLTLALFLMSFMLISTEKLIASGLLLLFLMGLNVFVGVSMYRFGKYMRKGIETKDSNMMEEGMKWLKKALMNTVVGIIIFVLYVLFVERIV
ncbi:MAG: hypothetical protein LBE34_12170 [Flavobacteriaceae bacterium]|jgi:hypothetical protein|nr:hypothetical protein [Flavobacteriaceae bacterium]